MKRQKRRRTRSTNSNSPSPGRGFFIPGFNNLGAAQETKLSLSDVMDAAKGLTNMYLAHEIAVNKDFMMQDLEGKVDEKGLEAQVRYISHFVI
jgi:hypothetical protein